MVDRGEAQIRHLIQLSQWLEDGQADFVGVDLAGACLPNGFFHTLGKLSEVLVGNRPALAGLSHTNGNFLARKRLGDPAALDDAEARGFEGAKASAALWALPAATNRQTVVAGARINHPGVGVAAEGAIHLLITSVRATCTNRLRVSGKIFRLRKHLHKRRNLGKSGIGVVDELLRAKEGHG